MSSEHLCFGQSHGQKMLHEKNWLFFENYSNIILLFYLQLYIRWSRNTNSYCTFKWHNHILKIIANFNSKIFLVLWNSAERPTNCPSFNNLRYSIRSRGFKVQRVEELEGYFDQFIPIHEISDHSNQRLVQLCNCYLIHNILTETDKYRDVSERK